MIRDIKEIYIPEGVTLTEATCTLSDMGERSITTTVKFGSNITPDFSRDWIIEFQGVRYIMPLREPQISKDNTSVNTIATLTFECLPEYQLKRWLFHTVQPNESGTAVADKYVASISLNLENFSVLLGQVLAKYYGDSFVVDLNPHPTAEYKKEPSNVEISHSHIWNVISEIYNVYKVRWEIVPTTDSEHYAIKIGYDKPDINHIFKYGFEGGLMKIERQLQETEIRNILIGRGAEDNLPYRYFKGVDEDNPTFSADPDACPELANISFDRLRGATFRSYIQGWNAKHHGGQTNKLLAYSPEAWERGYTDTKFNPIECVWDEASIAKYGMLQSGLEDNDDIYPTIQGVELPELGRIDETIAVEKIVSDEIIAANPSDSTVTKFDKWYEDFIIEANTPVIQRKYRDYGPSFNVPQGHVGSVIHGDLEILKGSAGVEILDYTLIALKHAEGRPFEDLTEVHITDLTSLPPGNYSLTFECTLKNMSNERAFVDVGFRSTTVLTSNPNPKDSNTWDIWVKNIWQSSIQSGETALAYAERVWTPILGGKDGSEAKVVFSDGFLSISEDYEFTIAETPVYDPTKTRNGVESHWRIRLSKSNADYDALKLLVPNIKNQAQNGDHFFFTGIELPHSYVVWAEEKLDEWKKAELSKVRDTQPTWVVTTDRVRLNEDRSGTKLIDQLQVGSLITLEDNFSSQSSQTNVYIQTLTYKFREPSSSDTALNPDIEIVLSNDYSPTASSVSLLQGDVQNLTKAVGYLQSGSDSKFNMIKEFVLGADNNLLKLESRIESLEDFSHTLNHKDIVDFTDTVEQWLDTTSPTIDGINGNIDSVKDRVKAIEDSKYATRITDLEAFKKNHKDYTLPTADSSKLGGIKIGYTEDGKNYPLQLDTDGKGYVNVPWSDTNTTYADATQSQSGLLSATDKVKLDGLQNALNSKVTAEQGKRLMSDAEGTKLAGIATGANNYTLPNATKSTLGGVKVGANISVDSNGVISVSDTSAKATKLENTRTIWGQNFDGTQNVTGSLSSVSGIAFSNAGSFNFDNNGNLKATTDSVNSWNVFSKAGVSLLRLGASGENGSTNVSNFRFFNNAQVDGTLTSKKSEVSETLKIGQATLSYDSAKGMLKIDKGVYSVGSISALGSDGSVSGSTGGGVSYPRLDDWSAYTEGDGSILSAKLGVALKDTVNAHAQALGRRYTKDEVDTKFAGKSDTTHNHDEVYSKLGHTHAYLPLAGGTMSNTNLVKNLNANYLDGWSSVGKQGKVLKKNCCVSVGKGDNNAATCWYKIASGATTGYDEHSAILLISEPYHKDYYSLVALHAIAYGNCTLSILSGTFPASSLRLYVKQNKNGGTSTLEYELWVKCVTEYSGINVSVLSETGRSSEENGCITLHSQTGNNPTPPTLTTYVECKYSDYLGNASTATDSANSAKLDGKLPSYYAKASDLTSHLNSTSAHSFANISNKPTTLQGYGITDAMTATDITAKIKAVRDYIDSLFVKDGDKIKAKFSLYSVGSISALGSDGTVSGGTGGGVSYPRLDSWSAYNEGDGSILSATLGKGLKDTVDGHTSQIGVINTKLQGKSDNSHKHDDVYSKTGHKHVKADISDFAHTHTLANITDLSNLRVDWSKLNNVPTTFTPSAHTHDYAASNHDHNSVYAPSAHTHDDRYYTKSESDANYFRRIGTIDSSDTVTDTYTPAYGKRTFGSITSSGKLPADSPNKYSYGQHLVFNNNQASFQMYVSHRASNPAFKEGIAYRSGYNDLQPWVTLLDSNNHSAYLRDSYITTGTAQNITGYKTFEGTTEFLGKKRDASATDVNELAFVKIHNPNKGWAKLTAYAGGLRVLDGGVADDISKPENYAPVFAKGYKIVGLNNDYVLLAGGGSLSVSSLAKASDYDAFVAAFNKAFTIADDGSVTAKVGLSSLGYLSAKGTDSTSVGGSGASYGRIDAWSALANSDTTSVPQAKLVRDSLATKVDKADGMGLSSNDYTATEKAKLAGIADGANNYKHPNKHTIAEVDGLETALNGKSYTTHTHDTVYSKLGHTHAYLPLTGGEVTGMLTVKTDNSQGGIKLKDTTITALEGNVIFRNNNSIRFGGNAWDWNNWAGLKYNHSTKRIYLGLADGSAFTANAAQSGGSIYTPGISSLYVGGESNIVAKITSEGVTAKTFKRSADNVEVSYSDHKHDSDYAKKSDHDALVTVVDGKADGDHDHNAKYLGINAQAKDSAQLGGKEASQYALVHNHPYLPTAGGTLTGALTITPSGSMPTTFGSGNPLFFEFDTRCFNAFRFNKPIVAKDANGNEHNLIAENADLKARIETLEATVEKLMRMISIDAEETTVTVEGNLSATGSVSSLA